MEFANATRLAAIAAAISVAGAPVRADVIHESDDPFGGFFGVIGADVSEEQRVGVRFTPQADYTLDRAAIWFMNNDWSGEVFGTVHLSLQTDEDPGGEFESVPSGKSIEEWTFQITAIGWEPVQEWVESASRPVLEAGRHYWFVAESDATPGLNPVWNWCGEGNGFSAIDNRGAGWTSGFGAELTLHVEGTPVDSCVADFNDDGALNLFDFLAFQSAFGDEDPRADVNDDGQLNLFDFLAFQTAFGQGC